MKATTLRRPIHIRILLLGVISPIALYAVYSILPDSQDWILNFRPSVLLLLHGQSPYVPGFYNAPWTLLPLIPFALLPPKLGQFGIFLLGFLAFAYIAYAVKAKPLAAILWMTSLPVLSCLFGGGIDWMPMLSFVLPAPIALVFAVTKPQIGVGIALYWLIESWRVGKVKEIIKNFLPVSLMLIASFVMYGFWFKSYGDRLNVAFNISLFPYLFPVGIYLLYSRQKHAAMASSICLSPYFTVAGLAAPLLALMERPRWMLVAWILLWTYPILSLIWQ